MVVDIQAKGCFFTWRRSIGEEESYMKVFKEGWYREGNVGKDRGMLRKLGICKSKQLRGNLRNVLRDLKCKLV